MKVTYLYDVPGWALHHVGLSLRPHFTSEGHEFELLSAPDYFRRPFRTDILYLSYSGLMEDDRFAYRRYARELICTLHDPLEISHFTDRFDWIHQPLRRVRLDRFDRVSVISAEMFSVLQRHYRPPALFLTATFPHDADDIRNAARNARPRPRVRFFSASNAQARHPLNIYVNRARRLPDYLLDHRAHPSLRQLRSYLIRTTRKNIAQLERLRRTLLQDAAEVEFMHSRQVMKPRAEYVTDLVNSDVYVCTSFMEGGPLPVMEAVIAGLAVISTPVGQVTSWVESGRNGFLCTTYDEMIDAARRYLRDPALLRAHQSASAEIGRERRLQFDPWRRFVLGSVGVTASEQAT